MTSIVDLQKQAYSAFKPPKKLSLSDWADEYAYLSVESSAEGGRWRTLPYQKAIMDAVTNPDIDLKPRTLRVVVQPNDRRARVGPCSYDPEHVTTTRVVDGVMLWNICPSPSPWNHVCAGATL